MANRNNNVLNDDRIGRLLLKLSMPAFFGMFVMTLYNVIDTIFIGHFVGSLAIAGLSIVFPVQMFAMGVGQMIGLGGASLISRLIGSGNISRAERALGNAIFSVVILGVSIMGIGLLNPDFWLKLIGASENILPYARDYMIIILVGMVFQTLAMSLNALIRAEGNARVSMMGMIIGAVINIILDAVFIIPLDMGVQGAALATVIAQLISAAYLLIYYFSGRSFLKIHIRNFIIEFNILKDIVVIGVASFARTMTGSLSVIFVNRMLILYGGDMAVSAFGIVNRVMMFAIMPGIVIGQGLQPILGFNYGAKRYHLALRAIKMAIIAGTVCGILAFTFLYFVPEPVIRVFTSESELVTSGAYAARRVFLALALVAPMVTGSLIFQSLGKATQSFLTAIVRPIFIIPLVFLLPQLWQLEGVWLALPVSDFLSFIFTMLLLVPQMRKLGKMEHLTGEMMEVAPAEVEIN